MTSGDTQPTVPLPEWAPERTEPRRRRRVWPWLVALGVVVALAIGAFFVADAVVRDLMIKTLRQQIATRTGIDASGLTIEIPGLVLPQLASGEIDAVTIAADDVVFESFSGDVVVEARGIPIRGDADLSDASATVTLDEDQLRTLMSQVEGFPADSLGLDAPNVTMSTELTLFSLTLPVGVALTPSASPGGDIVLTPASFEAGGVGVTADALRDQFGLVADAVLRDWDVCVAGYLPAGLSLTDVRVEGEHLVAGFDIAPGILHDPALQADGVCE